MKQPVKVPKIDNKVKNPKRPCFIRDSFGGAF